MIERAGDEEVDEVGELTGRFNAMVEGLRERERIRETFGRYVDESVASTILHREGTGVLAGETRDATVLFTDIAGFTSIGERLTADWLIDASGWRRVLDLAGATEGRDRRLVIGTEDHVPTAAAPRADGFAFYLEKQLLKSGYGWSFPAGDHVRAGVGSFIKEPLQPAIAAR